MRLEIRPDQSGSVAVLEEPGGAALGHAAEQLQDLEPEQRHERLLAGIGQIRVPALARGAEDTVVVDADDAADPDALAPLQCGEGAVEVGAGDGDFGEHGLGLGAARSVEPIPWSPQQAMHVSAPALFSWPRAASRQPGPTR